MIVLNVTYILKPGMRNAYMEKVAEIQMAEKSQAEAGNITYEYFLPLEGKDRIFLLEKWQDEEAFKAHMQEDHFRALGELKSHYVKETIIEKYSV